MQLAILCEFGSLVCESEPKSDTSLFKFLFLIFKLLRQFHNSNLEECKQRFIFA